jgi:hypothetical protein
MDVNWSMSVVGWSAEQAEWRAVVITTDGFSTSLPQRRFAGAWCVDWCPASRIWRVPGQFKVVKDVAVGAAEVDLDRAVPSEGFVRSGHVELVAVVLGVRGEGEAIGNVLAVEPLVFQ